MSVSVQDLIEKKLAEELGKRFLNSNETDYSHFDPRDVEMVKKNDDFFHLFIRAREGDLEKAYDMMVESLKWRKSYEINDITDETLDKDVLKEGILFYHNLDRENRPILIFQGNKYPYKTDRRKAKELEKVFAYFLEKQQKQNPGKQILVICDHNGATLSNMDLDFFKFIVNLFSIYYPEILDSFIVLNISWRLSASWKVIKSWLSPYMSVKFKYLDISKLTDYVDKSKLLISMNGEDKFKYSYPPLPDNVHVPVRHDENSVNKNNNDEGASSSHLAVPQEDFENSFEDQIMEEKKPVLSTEERIPHFSSRSKVMGSSLGTQVRHRFKDHQHSSSMEKQSSEPHLEENTLIVRPSEEIVFREVENEDEVQETVTLKNTSENTIIFKVQTNSAKKFRVRPHVGALSPDSSRDIKLMLLLKDDSGQEKQHYSHDKVKILFTEQTDPVTSATDISELWKSVPKIDTKEHRLNCRVLDIHGFEKRPKTIDDVLEMSLKLKEQISRLDAKVGKLNDSSSQIMKTLRQQTLTQILVIGLIVLVCVISWLIR